MKPLLDNELGKDLASGVATILRSALDHALEHPNLKPNTRGIHELCESLANIADVTKPPEETTDLEPPARKWWQIRRK